VIKAGLQVGVTELFAAWLKWCEQQGRKYPGSAQTFGRDLRAALPWIKIVQPHISLVEGTNRKRLYEGLRLKAGWE
jgi:putative DNA primase/helicase